MRVGDSFLVKHHGLILVLKYAVFQMGAHRFCENALLQVSSLADQILHRMSVTDLDHVLGNDGTLIKGSSDVVRGRTNHLDSSCIGLVVWASARKGRQKAVMNVDDRDAGF